MTELFDPAFWDALLDHERYEAALQAMGGWAFVAAVGAMIVVSFLPLPAETVAIANGMVFGHWVGFVVTWVGAMVAAMLAFALARWLGRPLVERRISSEKLQQFETLLEQKGLAFLLLARMIPLIPYTVVNYGSGLSPVRFSTYVLASAIGMTPPIIAFVSAGSLMTEAKWLESALLVIAAMSFVALAYLLYRGWQDRSRVDH